MGRKEEERERWEKMDYTHLVKKVVSKINEDVNLKEINVYTVMFWLNTSKYEKVMPVLDYLVRRGVLRKEGKSYIIVAREGLEQTKKVEVNDTRSEAEKEVDEFFDSIGYGGNHA